MPPGFLHPLTLCSSLYTWKMGVQCWCSYSGEYEQYGIAERDPEGLLLDNACKFPLLEASGSSAKGTKRKRKGKNDSKDKYL